jgi:hypothetical protein
MSLTTVVSWASAADRHGRAVHVFAGVVVSLALTRGPFPTGQVYGVDLLGAALGCVAVLALLNVSGRSLCRDCGRRPSPALSSQWLFAASAGVEEVRHRLRARALVAAAVGGRGRVAGARSLQCAVAARLQPHPGPRILIDYSGKYGRFEKWNSFSRIRASRPRLMFPELWGASPKLPAETRVPEVVIGIDGLANTTEMFHYDSTPNSNDFLKFDLALTWPIVFPASTSPRSSAWAAAQDILSAHLFGVTDITGVEAESRSSSICNTRDPLYAVSFSNHHRPPQSEAARRRRAQLVRSLTRISSIWCR